MIGTMFAMVWGFIPFLTLVADAAFPEKEMHTKTTGVSLQSVLCRYFLFSIYWLEICMKMCLIEILVKFFARREGKDNHEEQLEQTFLSDLQ